MLDDRWSDAFVGEGKMNRPIAAVEFEDGSDRCAHLLALHVSGVTRNTQSQESNKGCNHCVISAGATRLRLFRHGADHIAGLLSVNQSNYQPSTKESRFRVELPPRTRRLERW